MCWARHTIVALALNIERVETNCQKAQAEYLRLDNGADLARLLALHFIRRLLRGGTR